MQAAHMTQCIACTEESPCRQRGAYLSGSQRHGVNIWPCHSRQACPMLLAGSTAVALVRARGALSQRQACPWLPVCPGKTTSGHALTFEDTSLGGGCCQMAAPTPCAVLTQTLGLKSVLSLQRHCMKDQERHYARQLQCRPQHCGSNTVVVKQYATTGGCCCAGEGNRWRARCMHTATSARE